MLQIDEQAPDFTLIDQDQKSHSLSDYRGQCKIVYFYPKDDTPGCTKEACMIRDSYDDFEKHNVKVFGVSKDSPDTHKKFAEKYELPFTLLSDEDTTMIQAYGAWQEKNMYGKKYMGIQRMSYLINPDNIIVKVYPKVSPAEHAHELLKDLKELQTI